MILSGQTIRALCAGHDATPMLDPFLERTVHNGKSFGLSAAGYDVRAAEKHVLIAGEMELGSTIERFAMPRDVMALVKDKSSWARRGLSVYNTVIEPGWHGFLTLELVFHGTGRLVVAAGDPIAQIIFYRLDHPAELPYSGKYQNQAAGPQPAIEEAS